MFGSDVTSHVRHPRLMDEFDKFAAKEGESLESVYERLTTLVNIMGCSNVRPIPMLINTKLLNFLQPEWSKYVIMKPRVRDAKYFKEQMLLAVKDEAGSNLNNEENDFMLDTLYGEETIEELTAAVMLMDRIQPAAGNAKTVPSYDAKADSKLAKKAFKEQENLYFEDIVDLEEKLSSRDQIIDKMGQSIQTIHMLGKKPNKVCDHFLKASFIVTLTIDSPTSYETVGNKMHKAFPLPGESSYWQYKFSLPVEGIPTARRMEIPLPGVCTAMMK
nr:hypothetical protein [Tanacetum cinerariifolium]